MASQDMAPARSGLDQLLPTWEGADKDQFQTFLTTILATGDTLASRLESIGVILLTSETTYDSAQTRQSQRIGSIGSVLGG